MLEQMAYAAPFLVDGFLVTLTVSVVVVSVSLVIGLLLGLGLVYGPWPLRWAVRLMSDTIRGIPVLVLIFFVYYGLPALGLNLPALTAAIVALILFKVAQVVENVRGAVGSIPRGQDEAAKAIGLTFFWRLRDVILPQAVRRFLPPWINGVTDAVKGSALISLLGVTDLMHAINQVIGRTYDALPLYIMGALIYFAVNYLLSLASRRLEARFAYIRE